MAYLTQPVTNVLGGGFDLQILPTSPGWRQVDWVTSDATTANISPFTRQQQVQRWAGADYWSGTLTLPVLTPAQAAQWTAALLALRGRLHAFQVGDQVLPGMQNPANALGAVPSCSTAAGVNQPGALQVLTNGWPPLSNFLMTTGDYIQLNYRLHKVISPPSSDQNGQAYIPIWPCLRETPSSLDITQPVGIFRRADDQLKWTQNYDGTVALSFAITEVR